MQAGQTATQIRHADPSQGFSMNSKPETTVTNAKPEVANPAVADKDSATVGAQPKPLNDGDKKLIGVAENESTASKR